MWSIFLVLFPSTPFGTERGSCNKYHSYVYLDWLLAQPFGLQIEKKLDLACTSGLGNQRSNGRTWWNAFRKGHLFTFVKVTFHYLPIVGVGCSLSSVMLSFTSVASLTFVNSHFTSYAMSLWPIRHGSCSPDGWGCSQLDVRQKPSRAALHLSG